MPLLEFVVLARFCALTAKALVSVRAMRSQDGDLKGYTRARGRNGMEPFQTANVQNFGCKLSGNFAPPNEQFDPSPFLQTPSWPL